MRSQVLIIGGGLAGLIAARWLHRAGIGFQLLEARGRLGGRILSADVSGEGSGDCFDLGPSWFWPGMQPAMAALIEELGLPVFPQHTGGDIVFQRTPYETPQRYRGMRQQPLSMRVAGGTGALISALASGLPAIGIRLDARVTRVELEGGKVKVSFVEASGREQSASAAHAIFALPPRLLEATVSFLPALDAEIARRWRDTPTWMAPHAKLFALYDRPFWRDAGLSGAAQSMVGPLVEIHDATTASGKAALFGFVGIPAIERVRIGQAAMIAASVHQLASLFGPQAAKPVATLFKDWAVDPLTATTEDRQAGDHPSPDPRPWVDERWRECISVAGSETSRSEPGYLAGAVEAAERTAAEIMDRFRSSRAQALGAPPAKS